MKSKLARKIIYLLCAAIVLLAVLKLVSPQMSRTQKITISLPGVTAVVDPSNVVTTSEWYFLSHVSGNLINYSQEEARFKPFLASSWTIQGKALIFNIRDNAFFSDGSPITSRDIAYSIKRQIVKKTASHFPVWDQLVGCESLKSIAEDCAGIEFNDPRTITFNLKQNVESFFLMLGSPEGGIWSAEDLLKSDSAMNVSRYSGAYSFKRTTDKKNILTRNSYSPMFKTFPDAPETIEFYSEGPKEISSLLEQKKIDVLIDSIQPFESDRYAKLGYNRSVSAFTTILYLSKIGNHSKVIGRPFFEELWNKKLGEDIAPADTVLPFGSLTQIDRTTFLSLIPEKGGEEVVRIAILEPYFRREISDLLTEVGRKVGQKIEMKPVSYAKWIELSSKRTVDSEFDFVFTIYVASERFPSVQMRFLLDGRSTPFSFEAMDSLEISQSKRDAVFGVEKWMLETQQILPLLFTRTQIVSLPNVDIGAQPISDGEIQFWRVRK